MKAIGYIRVSSEDQAESGLSLEHQRTRIAAYCVAADVELVAIHEDAGRSAKDMNRPGLADAMAAIKAGAADALVILKLDRLTRSVRDLGELVSFFDKTGAALVAVQDSINTSTAAGRLVLNVLGSVAQWEREAIGERTAAALAVKRERKEKTGGTVPYGFELGDGGRLVENPSEQTTLATIRELRAGGRSLNAIARELTARGITSKTGGKWHAKVVAGLVERMAA